MARSNGTHAETVPHGNGNGHRPVTETVPIVVISSPGRAESSKSEGSSRIPEPYLASEAEPLPGAAADDGFVQASAPGAEPSIQDWYASHRERLGVPRREWPVEAERSSERLKYNQAMAVELLITGMTKTDVARQLGVDRSTVHRWLTDPFFVAQLEARRDEVVESMLDLQVLAGRMATAKLIELLESPNEQVALRAAIALYAGGHRAYQFIDLRKRVERLEDNLHITYGFKV